MLGLSISLVCKKYNIPLLVDNAHGAYLNFVGMHPIELGASMCCDSAHKTLNVLTGGAYLHISKECKDIYSHTIKNAMAFFGSTSPSYLTLCSLDLCNKYLVEEYSQKLQNYILKVKETKDYISKKGFEIFGNEPLKITVRANGVDLSEKFRALGGECEYFDEQFIVFMVTPENSDKDFELIKKLFQNATIEELKYPPLLEQGEKVMSLREAMFSKQENVEVKDAIGRICASPTVSCPPAVPIAVSGEIITEKTVKIFDFYGIKQISCVKK